jgi:hypothetical protein
MAGVLCVIRHHYYLPANRNLCCAAHPIMHFQNEIMRLAVSTVLLLILPWVRDIFFNINHDQIYCCIGPLGLRFKQSRGCGDTYKAHWCHQ